MSHEQQIRIGIFGTPLGILLALVILPVFWNGFAVLILVALGMRLIFKPFNFRSS